jgi:protein N-terminal methyltransferase
VDKEDSSLTRSNEYLLRLFAESNLIVSYNLKQRNFPGELFDVRMYALRPKSLPPSDALTARTLEANDV